MSNIKNWKKYLFPAVFILLLYLLIGCPFRFFFGVPCPGCGISRAWYSLLTGDFMKAFELNPLFFILPPLILVIIFKDEQIFKSNKLNSFAIGAMVIITLAVYVIRMLTLFPNVEPMVYNSDAVIIKIYSLLKEGIFL